MSRQRSASQLQSVMAQRRDAEHHRQEQLAATARYFDVFTKRNQQHEAWTTNHYYQKAEKDAKSIVQDRIKKTQLEERRKQLEMLFFQENLQYQEEMKALESRPRLFKNGSYLNGVSTSTLEDINLGIKAKEDALRQQEAELRVYHAWRARQPEVRAADSYARNTKLKTAWLEQTVEKELQKKKEEEDTKKILQERDEYIRRQIDMEEQKLQEKDSQMRELKTGLEAQIAQLNEAEKEVNKLRIAEERQSLILCELKLIREEREKAFSKMASEREGHIYNLGLHKHKLKMKNLCVQKEIEFDLAMIERIEVIILKEIEAELDKQERYRLILERTRSELIGQRQRERTRQLNIDSMFDGEARSLQQKQLQLWEKEREARRILMDEVNSTLQRQLEEKLEQNRMRHKENLLERERILDEMTKYHKDVQEKERERELTNSKYSNIAVLQSELNSLKLEQDRLQEQQNREIAIKRSLAEEEMLQQELRRIHRDGAGDLPARRKQAW